MMALVARMGNGGKRGRLVSWVRSWGGRSCVVLAMLARTEDEDGVVVTHRPGEAG